MQYSWDQINNLPSSIPDAAKQVIDSARSSICTLYRNYPGLGLPDPTGFGGIVSGFWDTVCPNDPPTPQTTGAPGACSIRYTYRVPLNNLFRPEPPPNDFYEFPFFSVGVPVVNPQLSGMEYISVNADGSTSTGFTNYGAFKEYRPEYGKPELVERLRSGDCPTPDYEPPIPQPEQPTDTPFENFTKDITIKPNPTTEFTIPIILVHPQLTNNFDVDVQLDFNFQFQLPDINLALTLDAGGITFNYINSPEKTPTPTLPPITYNPPPPPGTEPPEYIPPPSSTGETICPEVDLTEIEELLNDIKECVCTPERVLKALAIESSDSGDIQLPIDTVGVSLRLTEIPQNAKLEIGNTAPTVYYAGWAAYARGSDVLQRNPISYQRNFYPNRENVSRFTYTCRAGYEAQLVVWHWETVPV